MDIGTKQDERTGRVTSLVLSSNSFEEERILRTLLHVILNHGRIVMEARGTMYEFRCGFQEQEGSEP